MATIFDKYLTDPRERTGLPPVPGPSRSAGPLAGAPPVLPGAEYSDAGYGYKQDVPQAGDAYDELEAGRFGAADEGDTGLSKSDLDYGSLEAGRFRDQRAGATADAVITNPIDEWYATALAGTNEAYDVIAATGQQRTDALMSGLGDLSSLYQAAAATPINPGNQALFGSSTQRGATAGGQPIADVAATLGGFFQQSAQARGDALQNFIGASRAQNVTNLSFLAQQQKAVARQELEISNNDIASATAMQPAIRNSLEIVGLGELYYPGMTPDEANEVINTMIRAGVVDPDAISGGGGGEDVGPLGALEQPYVDAGVEPVVAQGFARLLNATDPIPVELTPEQRAAGVTQEQVEDLALLDSPSIVIVSDDDPRRGTTGKEGVKGENGEFSSYKRLYMTARDRDLLRQYIKS